MIAAAPYPIQVNKDGYIWVPGGSLGTPVRPGMEGVFTGHSLGSDDSDEEDDLEDENGIGADDDDQGVFDYKSRFESVLVSVMEGAAPPDLRSYKPLEEHPGLFLEFAELATTEDSILSFARKYGLLGVPVAFGESLNRQSGEPVEYWRREIETLRDAIDIWDACRANNLVRLREIGAWDNQPLAVTDIFDQAELRQHVGRMDSFKAWKCKQLHDHALVEELNSMGLRRAALKYLAWLTSGKFRENTSLALGEKEDSPDRPFRIQYAPKSLLGCLWLQFAAYLSDDRNYRRCEICGRWTEIAKAEGTRSSRLYCSDVCRRTAYRKRILTFDLQKDGKAPEEISKTTGLKEELIRRWLLEGPKDRAKTKRNGSAFRRSATTEPDKKP